MGNSFTTTTASGSGDGSDTVLDITEDEIKTLARTPKKVENDEGKVEERTIAEFILADQYTKQGEATGTPYGLKIGRTRPPGTV